MKCNICCQRVMSLVMDPKDQSGSLLEVCSFDEENSNREDDVI